MRRPLLILLAMIVTCATACTAPPVGPGADGGGTDGTDLGEVSAPEGPCRVVMTDALNGFQDTLQAEQRAPDAWVVTAGLDTTEPWNVSVHLRGDRTLEFDACVPAVTIDSLLTGYPMVNSRTLTFVEPADHRCTAFESSLIYFLVLEWFYYG